MAKESNKINERNSIAFIIVLLSVIGYIIYLALNRKDDYLKYYAKHSLVLFFAFLICWVVSIIPIIGWIIGPIAYVLTIILWILTMVYALQGQKKEVFLITEFTKKI